MCDDVNYNSLTNDKILDWSKLKPFADDKRFVTEKLKFVLERVENMVGIGENAGVRTSSRSGLCVCVGGGGGGGG